MGGEGRKVGSVWYCGVVCEGVRVGGGAGRGVRSVWKFQVVGGDVVECAGNVVWCTGKGWSVREW
jgi:hypothetical protein